MIFALDVSNELAKFHEAEFWTRFVHKRAIASVMRHDLNRILAFTKSCCVVSWKFNIRWRLPWSLIVVVIPKADPVGESKKSVVSTVSGLTNVKYVSSAIRLWILSE